MTTVMHTKFKVGDVVIDNQSKDVAIILGIDELEGLYEVDCIDAGLGVWVKGLTTWAIDWVDLYSSLHEASIVDKILTKYNNL